MLHHDPQAIWSGDFLWWTVQDLHTVRPAVPVVVPPSSAGKRATKKQFCRSRTARFAIRGKSALAELGCTTCSLQTVLKFFDCHFPLIFWAFLPFRFSVVLFLNHKNRCFLLLRFKLQSLKNVSHNTLILKQSNSKTLFPRIF